jgi:hypothetical protein
VIYRPSIARGASREAFRAAIGLGLVVGVVALVLPFLNSLSAATAAIAFAMGVRGRNGSAPADSDPSRATAWVVGTSLLGGVAAFVALPLPWSTARGLVLGASFLPWLFLDRRGSPSRRTGT